MTRTLPQWLLHLEHLHPRTIDLGLTRVRRVWERMSLPVSFPVITVAGTNGKGSTCAFLECMLRCAGYRTALYTSPHLLCYNERVRFAGEAASDAQLCHAFEQVEAARGDVPLTFFEFGTLAALHVFIASKVEVAVLEVGLGGRLDAVNLIDPDVAVVTSIGIDHVDFLGPTREHIGYEKAGILRQGVPAVCGDREPPSTLLAHAAHIGAPLQRVGLDFDVEGHATHWDYCGAQRSRKGLPWPALRGQVQLLNAASALAALDCLHERVPVDMGAIRRGLVEVQLPGRFQVIPGRPLVVLDVAHNPDSARELAANLAAQTDCAQTFAVMGMLRDKDIEGVVRHLFPQVSRWFLTSLGGPRGASAERLAQAVNAVGSVSCACYANPVEAFESARSIAEPNDRIVTFGSFLTVADVLAYLQRTYHG